MRFDTTPLPASHPPSPPDPPQPATPSIYVDTSHPAGLDGLRALFDQWKEEGAQKKEVKPPLQKEENVTQEERDATVASVYTQYQKMATQEDRGLVSRWTETLNILLTFAGLLSAVITAFLLASQPDLQPSPHTSTNKILSHIAQMLDNTTAISNSFEEPLDNTPALRALAYWHASLGCSLMSAFGSLLSKQWVLHFQSTPVWANTMEEQCRLREVRAYGLSKWRMHAIIESLPVLLQLSVFLFYLGLRESLASTPVLSKITLSFAVIIAFFYVSTLVAGAYFSSCPFKSPVTNFKKGVTIIAVSVIFQSFVVITGSKAIRSQTLGAFIFMISIFVLLRLQSSPLFDSGERELAQGSRGSTGVMFWWLMGHQLNVKPLGTETQVVASAVKRIPTDTLVKVATWRDEFGSWCSQVFKALASNHPSETARHQADLVCHLMHHSRTCIQAIRPALTDKDLNGDFDWPWTPKVFGYVCNTLRKGWTPKHSEPTPMPVSEMQPTTFSVYFQYQLLDWVYAEEFRKRSYLELIFQTLPVWLQPRWIYGEGSRRRKNRSLLLQELTAALQPEYFTKFKFVGSIINAVGLAAIALVPDDTLPYLQPVEGLVDSSRMECLFQAIHRLSYYPLDHSPSELILVAVSSTTRVILSIQKPKELYKCSSWKSGELGESLYRLLHLGRIWWHKESGTSNSRLGASLVHQMHGLMYTVTGLAIKGYRIGGSTMLFPSPASVQEVFATYAHPSGPNSKSLTNSTKATELLHALLALRYLSISSPSIISRLQVRLRIKGNLSVTWLKTPTFTLNPADYPYVVRLLVHNLRTAPANSWLKLASLSLVVKGRDIFLPSPIRARYPRVASDIDDLSERILPTNGFNNEIPWQSYADFNRWNGLLRALEELEQNIGTFEPPAIPPGGSIKDKTSPPSENLDTISAQHASGSGVSPERFPAAAGNTNREIHVP